MKTPLFIWGASGHGKVVADASVASNLYQIAAFFDDDTSRHHTSFCHAPILPPPSSPPSAPTFPGQPAPQLFIAVGNNHARLKLAQAAVAQGWKLATIIHPRSIIAADVQIGPGTLVAAGAVINPGSIIGSHCIINTAACIDHDCIIGQASHLAPGSTLAGRVHIGELCFIGVGASIRDGMVIGHQVTIGAGAAVVSMIPDHTTALGVPAKPIPPTSPPK